MGGVAGVLGGLAGVRVVPLQTPHGVLTHAHTKMTPATPPNTPARSCLRARPSAGQRPAQARDGPTVGPEGPALEPCGTGGCSGSGMWRQSAGDGSDDLHVHGRMSTGDTAGCPRPGVNGLHVHGRLSTADTLTSLASTDGLHACGPDHLLVNDRCSKETGGCDGDDGAVGSGLLGWMDLPVAVHMCRSSGQPAVSGPLYVGGLGNLTFPPWMCEAPDHAMGDAASSVHEMPLGGGGEESNTDQGGGGGGDAARCVGIVCPRRVQVG